MKTGHVLIAGWGVGLVMSDRQRYPSDVTDEQWALIGPFLDAWRAKRISVAGRHGEQDLREIVNASEVDTARLDRRRIGDRVGLARSPSPCGSTADRHSFALLAPKGVDLFVEQFVLLAKLRDGLPELAHLVLKALVLRAAGATDSMLGRSAAAVTRCGTALRAWPVQVRILDRDDAFRHAPECRSRDRVRRWRTPSLRKTPGGNRLAGRRPTR